MLGPFFKTSRSTVWWPLLKQCWLLVPWLTGPVRRAWLVQLGSVQSFSCVRLFGTPWTAARQASLSITNPELTQTHAQQVGDVIQPSLPLSSPSPPAFNFSQDQGLFQWVSSSHHMAKVLELQLQHQSEYSGLFTFRMDWLDLLADQGTLKSLPQHHSSKKSILWCSIFFTVQLSHSYVTTGKTIALTILWLLSVSNVSAF